ncbi:hypothetical protein DVH24_017336 [Malus domestica]|uniref:Peptidase C1A papain C-terminal domain-containing protein n=1 Tax=Malus domestica TaxID=3750 RepID=A0A498IXT9_MALDO|nr:hypothetical protein DVH24_017336 [Malus domestica]
MHYTLSINEFAGLTNEEFREHSCITGYKKQSSKAFVSKGAAAGFKHGSVTDVPPSVEWGEEGIVTPIKDQENVVKITWLSPVFVASDASRSAFHLYSSRVLTGTGTCNLDHFFTAVGYETSGDGTMDSMAFMPKEGLSGIGIYMFLAIFSN